MAEMQQMTLRQSLPKWSLAVAILEPTVLATVWHWLNFGAAFRLGIVVGTEVRPPLWNLLWDRYNYPDIGDKLANATIDMRWAGFGNTLLTFLFLPLCFYVLVRFTKVGKINGFIGGNEWQRYSLFVLLNIILAVLGIFPRSMLFDF